MTQVHTTQLMQRQNGTVDREGLVDSMCVTCEQLTRCGWQGRRCKEEEVIGYKFTELPVLWYSNVSSLQRTSSTVNSVIFARGATFGIG